MNFISNKTYAIHFFGPEGEVVKEIDDMPTYDQTKVAYEIGRVMIEEGCVALSRSHELERDQTHFIVVARPFAKERRLP
jgi:hypothetical protein